MFGGDRVLWDREGVYTPSNIKVWSVTSVLHSSDHHPLHGPHIYLQVYFEHASNQTLREVNVELSLREVLTMKG